MQTLNVRLGLATNSSSSHSIVIVPPGKRLSAHKPGIRTAAQRRQDKKYGIEPNPKDTDLSYGWEYFTLLSEREKLKYLATQLWMNMGRDTPEWVRRTLVEELTGFTMPEITKKYSGHYVDHQSIWMLPRELKSNFLNRQFVEHLAAYLRRKDVAILGGNDNSAGHPDLATLGVDRDFYSEQGYRNDAWFAHGAAPHLPFTDENATHPNQLVARWDEQYRFWTLFNRQSGAKALISFEQDPTREAAVSRSTTPELVDIKLTDYCPYGCAFCYQGSTKEGKDATMRDVSDIFQELEKLGVLEVALGGGEPTLHPDFVEILERARYYNIVPNFTTKNVNWMRDADKRVRILKACGSFAVSVETAEDVNRLAKSLEKHKTEWRPDYGDDDFTPVYIHVVLGTMERKQFEEVLRAAGKHDFRVTLLGYKNVGFGADYAPVEHGWWLEAVEALRDKGHLPTISVDTQLALDFREMLEAADIPRILYTTEEGKFSCYIDAVAKTVRASSYDNNKGLPITGPHAWQKGAEVVSSEAIQAAYETF